MRTALTLSIVLAALAGCRLEEREADSPPIARLDSVAVTDTLETVGPPVPEGDSTRIDSTEAAVADPSTSEAPVVGPSGLVLPVAGIRPGDLVDTFEDARGQGREHDAIDIIAPQGTPVLAATDGTVLRLFESERGGLTIYQLGDDQRTVYYYAHLDAYAPGLAADQRVRRGQAIGTVGDTGNAAPGNYHLHFAIWTVDDPASFWDGEALNPYPLLGGR